MTWWEVLYINQSNRCDQTVMNTAGSSINLLNKRQNANRFSTKWKLREKLSFRCFGIKMLPNECKIIHVTAKQMSGSALFSGNWRETHTQPTNRFRFGRKSKIIVVKWTFCSKINLLPVDEHFNPFYLFECRIVKHEQEYSFFLPEIKLSMHWAQMNSCARYLRHSKDESYSCPYRWFYAEYFPHQLTGHIDIETTAWLLLLKLIVWINLFVADWI